MQSLKIEQASINNRRLSLTGYAKSFMKKTGAFIKESGPQATIVAALFCAALYPSCSSSRPMAHLIINNESGADIPISLSIARVTETT